VLNAAAARPYKGPRHVDGGAVSGACIVVDVMGGLEVMQGGHGERNGGRG